MYSYLSHLECGRCGQRYEADAIQGVCGCSSPLLARYDLERLAAEVSRDAIQLRAPDLWRYHELLPVADPAHVTTMGEGFTPIVPLAAAGAQLGVPGLLLKDDGVLPTGSFKARGAAVGVSRAAELGVTAIAMPTNGNAGAAWAQYASRARISTLIAMPEEAPKVCRGEILATNGALYLVQGHIGDCGRLIGQAIAGRTDTFDVSTLKEPYRLEGKKTMGFEIAEQLGWRTPDVIVYPTGGGVGIIGIYKALQELAALGWIEGRFPRLVAVQSAGCAPIAAAYEQGADESQAWPHPATIAFGINVPKALGDFLVLEAVRKTGGTAIAVEDEDIRSAQRDVATVEGMILCPEGAATIAAVRQLRETGWLESSDTVVALNTGSGSRYPELLPADAVTISPTAAIPLR